VIAHVGGVPVEELMPAAAGAGTALLVVRGWVGMRLRRAIKRAPPQG
jgi:cytochrome oxidase assembly protein ShyY1